MTAADICENFVFFWKSTWKKVVLKKYLKKSKRFLWIDVFDNVILKILEVCERLSVRKSSSSESFTACVRVCVRARARVSLSLLQLANRIGNEAKPRACITAEQCPAVQLFSSRLA